MDEVKFEAERVMEAPTSAPRRKGIAAFMVRTGVVKTEGQANLLMVIVALLLLVGAGFLFMKSTQETRVDLPPLPTSTL